MDEVSNDLLQKDEENSYLLSKTNPASSYAERHADNEPNQNDYHHGCEGHCAARLFDPQEEVEQEEHGKCNSRDQ